VAAHVVRLQHVAPAHKSKYVYSVRRHALVRVFCCVLCGLCECRDEIGCNRWTVWRRRHGLRGRRQAVSGCAELCGVQFGAPAHKSLYVREA
jgi:hypothetical protein